MAEHTFEFQTQDIAVAMLSASPDGSPGEQPLLPREKLDVLFSAFCLAVFLVVLDQTILSTALPLIAAHCHTVSGLAWVASAYLLPTAAFMLFVGKVLALAPDKTVFLLSISIFELGNLICAAAPSVGVLIPGCAAAGLGATGLWVTVMAVVARISPSKQEHVLMNLFGTVFAVSSVVGLLIGCALSDHVSWRWCFYMNLSMGGVLASKSSVRSWLQTYVTDPEVENQPGPVPVEATGEQEKVSRRQDLQPAVPTIEPVKARKILEEEMTRVSNAATRAPFFRKTEFGEKKISPDQTRRVVLGALMAFAGKTVP